MKTHTRRSVTHTTCGKRYASTISNVRTSNAVNLVLATPGTEPTCKACIKAQS